ncbi:phosphoribosylglycinamide formyltransferase [Acidisoma sp. S159]|jgi:phosphoribosylglycinamide formyltransferase 1|uniref:phosphoribosylglycinamide formyltransferase n=3 Tax=unclassified Acidisoma TaxID=2634065 RepID=UPI00131B3E5D|nr:phosphoribosylglycinamide formyltransferase [Acidisoma sp. S159]
MSVSRRRVGILISGRGSNMMALVAAAAAPDFPAEIALVLSNNPEAEGLASAAARGVATEAIDHRTFGRDRASHEAAMDAALVAHGVELICLAGYMRLLTPWLVARWAGRMINIHPSLLPAFTGLHTHARAIEAGVTLHGCTVHLVTEALDAGPILAQAAVPVIPGDTETALAARVLRQEHALYPQALRDLIDPAGKRAAAPEAALINPLPRRGAGP